MDWEQNIYVKETKDKGKSLFAKKSFKKGEFIFLIAGPIVNKASIYTVPIATGLWKDPVPVENPAKYLCHSCEPSAGIKQRTIVVAFKDIEEDKEITIDYAMIVYAYGDEITEEGLKCQCGNKNCRGKLGNWAELSEELKQKYKGFVSEYVLLKTK